MRPRTPLHSKTAISLFMAAGVDLSFMELCSTEYWLTPRLNPSNPGFCPHTNPGLRVWKRAGYPGFRVPGYSGCIPYIGVVCCCRIHAWLRWRRISGKQKMSWFGCGQLIWVPTKIRWRLWRFVKPSWRTRFVALLDNDMVFLLLLMCDRVH